MQSVKIIYFVLLTFLSSYSLAAPKNPIDSDIRAVEMNRSGEELSRQKVTVFLNNKGKPKASIRLEVEYPSAPNAVNRLHIWAKNVPVLRERLVGITEGKLAYEVYMTPIEFGVDKGWVKPLESNGKKYISLLTTEGSFVFAQEDIAQLLSLLDVLEKSITDKNK